MQRLRTIAALLAILLVACGTDAPASTTNVGSTARKVEVSAGGVGPRHTVGIVQQTTHPALDEAHKGVVDALKASGLNIAINAANAHGDPAQLATIVDGFRDAHVDLVFAIGTRAAQAAQERLRDSGIPIVFNSVTDPYSAGIARSETDHPGVTGVQAMAPVPDAFDLITIVKPSTKTVGTIWTSSEKNSEVSIGIARRYAESKGIRFIERQVTRADEVAQAAQALAADHVDAIFISTDSTVVSVLEAVVAVANTNDIPLFCNDPMSAERGCIAGLGLDYYDNGYSSAKQMGLAIIKGAKPDDLPIQQQAKQIIVINTAAAKEQGATIPPELAKQATKTLTAIKPAR